MNPKAMLFRLLPFLLLLPLIAQADWIDPGAAYKCDKTGKSFGLMATMATSSPETPGEVQIAEGYSAISKERDETVISCRFGSGFAVATVRLFRAHERGRCAAFDHLDIAKLQFNGQVLLEYENFSSGCHSDPVLHQVELRFHLGKLFLRTCRAAWMWDSGYAPESCEDRVVSVD